MRYNKNHKMLQREAGLSSDLLWWRVGWMSVVTLAGLVTIMACPIVNEAVNAETIAQGASASMALEAKSTLTVALSKEEFALDIDPTMDGASKSDVAELSIITNDASEYSVFLSTKDGTQNLSSTNESVIAKVGPVNGSQPLADFGANTWGYALGEGIDVNTAVYKAVPQDTSMAVLRSEVASGVANDQYKLAFGAKIDTSLPAGQYTNQVNVSVIVTPLEVTRKTLSDITTMQEMESEICTASGVGETATLKDVRDNNTYTVAKLKDDKCWMTQNLALKLNTGKTLTPNDTDVKVNYTPARSTLSSLTNNQTNTEQYSWNTGNGHGTYYQFNAATAGTGSSITGGDGIKRDASSSICPKGWRLPSMIDGDFVALKNAYGYGASDGSQLVGNTVMKWTLSGSVSQGAFSQVSQVGRYWYSTTDSQYNAYVISFTTDMIFPSDSSSRYYGCTVRCLAR